jgi:mRNA-degrading endonuclease toxin of MazEF toxin-antitoxin module
VADKRRPVIVVQADFLNRSAMDWILAVPLTSRLQHEGLPGNVRLPRRCTGLPRACVANVAQVAPLHRSSFSERVARLPAQQFALVAGGLRLVLGLDHQ